MKQLIHDAEFFTLYLDDEVRNIRFTISERLDAELSLAGDWAAVEKVAADYFELLAAGGPPSYTGHLSLVVAVLDRCLELERLLVANDVVLAEMAKVLAAQGAKEETT